MRRPHLQGRAGQPLGSQHRSTRPLSQHRRQDLPSGRHHDGLQLSTAPRRKTLLQQQVGGAVDFARPPSTYKERLGTTSRPHHRPVPNSQPSHRSNDMRFMVIVKANKDSEAGVMPTEAMLTAMGKYNEELVKAGVMLAGE